jgi:hypothetical protein
LKKVETDVAPAQLSASDQEKLREAERKAAMAIE